MVNTNKKIKQIFKQFEKKRKLETLFIIKIISKKWHEKTNARVKTRVWISDLRFVIQEPNSKFHEQFNFSRN